MPNRMNRSEIARVAKEMQLEHSRRLGPVYFHGPLMLPFLQEGDLLVIEPVRFEEVEIGDIITYRDAEKFPTARVIQTSERSVTVKADNFSVVSNVPAADVLGRVIERMRSGHRIVRSSIHWARYTHSILKRENMHLPC